MKRVHLRGVKLAWGVCLVQAIIGFIGAGVALPTAGSQAAEAALFGGVIAIVPTLWFALRVYFRRNGNGPRDVLGSFYRAEIGKFALTALLFYAGVRMYAEHFLPMLLTFMACFIAYPVVMASARID